MMKSLTISIPSKQSVAGKVQILFIDTLRYFYLVYIYKMMQYGIYSHSRH